MAWRVRAVGLKRRQREWFVDKLPDAGNLAIGGLAFGQFVATETFSPWLALLGVGLWVLFIGWAAVLAGKEEA